MKRSIDLFGAAVLLAVTAPLLTAVAVLVRSTSAGPAIFSQRRVGRDGCSIRIHKFRTMRSDAEHILLADPELFERYRSNGYKLSLDEDPRITPIGRILRKYSIDELPQLWNVARGEMSLVGPRPMLPDELRSYGPVADTYRLVRPGITGSWQVSGRDSVHPADRARLITDYVERWSVMGDLSILLRTIPAAVRARGVE